MPRLPHICELDLSLQPLEANIPPSIKRLSVPEPIHDHNHEHEHEHEPLSTSLFRLPSPAMSDDSYCSECPDCVDRKRKRDESEDQDEGEERPIKRSHSSSPTILAPMPLSPERAIANYLEGSLTI